MDAKRNSSAARIERGNVAITRAFDAPRELVFAAWSSAAHMKHWFAPDGFTVPFCEVDFRVGGTWRACQRAPNGKEYWGQGVFQEIVAPARIVFTDVLLGPIDNPRFEMLTTVTFTPEGRRTILHLDARVIEIRDPTSMPIVLRMGESWRQTLEHLALHLADPSQRKS